MKPLQRASRPALPTSWLMQSAFVTPAAFISSPAFCRPAISVLADVGQDAELLVRRPSPEFAEITGMPAATAFWIDGPRAVASGIETTRPAGFLRHGGVDELGHRGMSNVSGAAVLDLDAHVLAGLVDAVLEDRPERVGGLAVGHDLDQNAGPIGAAAAATAGRGRGRRVASARDQGCDAQRGDALRKLHVLVSSSRPWTVRGLTTGIRNVLITIEGPANGSRPWSPPSQRRGRPAPTASGMVSARARHAGISSRRTGRCSWSDLVAASAIRSASTPSRSVQGLGSSPWATRTKVASSAAYAAGTDRGSRATPGRRGRAHPVRPTGSASAAPGRR